MQLNNDATILLILCKIIEPISSVQEFANFLQPDPVVADFSVLVNCTLKNNNK